MRFTSDATLRKWAKPRQNARVGGSGDLVPRAVAVADISAAGGAGRILIAVAHRINDAAR
jgi:hypothetical protein